MAGSFGERLELYGQAGYVQVEDDERFGGFEFSLGGSYALFDVAGFVLGAFADYRLTNLEGAESQLELKLRDTRVGVRLTFGGGGGSMPAEGEDGVGVEPVVEESSAEEPAAEEPAFE